MQIDFRHVRKQFEKSMADYDKNAVVQDLTASKLVIELLKISDNFENILEIGTGTGLLTKKIAKDIRYKNFYANDLVEKSKSYVTKFIPNAHFICGNAAKIKVDRKLDLILSNAVLQWFQNQEKILEILKFKLKSGGILAFSSFSPSNFKELRELTGLSLKYRTREELNEILKSIGFEILYSEEFFEPVSFDNPLELLAHMKKTGVNSLSDTTWSITDIKNFCDKYSKLHKQTVLTYSPIIIIAKKLGN